MNCCHDCGGTLVGDGYTSVLHWEFYEGDICVAPDSSPLYCNLGEEDVVREDT